MAAFYGPLVWLCKHQYDKCLIGATWAVAINRALDRGVFLMWEAIIAGVNFYKKGKIKSKKKKNFIATAQRVIRTQNLQVFFYLIKFDFETLLF